MNTVTIGSNFAYYGFKRGDYIAIRSEWQYAETTSGLAGSRQLVPVERRRVIGVTPRNGVLTLRELSPNRLVEWCRARCEDWIVWPLADLRGRFRVKP